MANNLVKFYKVASLPATLVPGAIYFVTTTQSIHVATATDKSDVFGMGLKGATLENSVLTITRHDDTKVTVDFSDIASASSVVTALGTKLNIGASTDAAGTQSYYGLKKDIEAAQAAAQGAAKVKDVDTTAANGVNLSVDADGKLDVTVTTGSIAEGDTSVVTGGAVYTAIDAAKSELSGQISNKNVSAEGDTLVSASAANNKVTVAATEELSGAVALAKSALQAADKTELQNKIDAIDVVGDNRYIAVTAGGTNGDTFTVTLSQDAENKLETSKTTVNAKADGHVIVTVTPADQSSGDIVTITESDIASAQALSGVDERVAAIEAVMGGDDADKAINKVSEIITFLNGIEEGTIAKDTFDAVTAHGTAITNLQNNTVNGKKISENPVLAGSDVLLTGYTEQTASALTAADSINVALGKLEARVDAAAAGGVQSVGGKAGSIALDTDATGEGNVKFAISETGEISATVNIGATAAQGALADSAVQTVVPGSANGTIAVDGTDVAVTGLGSAAFTEAYAYDAAGAAETAESNAKAYTDAALTWVEFE